MESSSSPEHKKISSKISKNLEETDSFWTKDKCLELIHLYKDRNVLWDINHPYYYMRNIKIDTWEEISKSVGSTVPEVRTKISVLLSSFRREKAKVLKQIKKGDTKYTSHWFGFRPLSFLLLKESGNNKMNPDLSKLVPHAASARTYTKRPYKFSKSTFSTSEATEPRTDQQKTKINDEITSFTHYVASKMRKYSEATNNAVQQAICEILFKADQKMYEPGTCDSTVAVSIPSTKGEQASSSPVPSDSTMGTIDIVKYEPFDNDSL